MSTVASPIAPRKVGILLSLGVFFLPPIFVWFLLRQGYAAHIRVLGFGWLGVAILMGVSDKENRTTYPSRGESSFHAPAQISSNSGLEAASIADVKKVETVDDFAKDASIVAQIEKRIQANREHLRKYYGTERQLQEIAADSLALASAKVVYGDKGKSKEEKSLGRKAERLLVQVHEQSREIYASMMERVLVSNGMDAEVRAVGKGKKQLRIKYVLMSQPLIYKFQNELKLGQQARNIGFSKLIYTNGFESDMGETWTVDL